MYSTDEAMNNKCEIVLYDVRDHESPIRNVVVDHSKVTAAVWGPLDQYIITGHVNGDLSQYNILEVRETD